MRTMLAMALAGWLVALVAAPATAAEEPPALAPRVADGTLPPLAERLPDRPRVIDLESVGKTPGRYGGTLKSLVGRPADVRFLVVWGYARLVGYDTAWDLVPDILERVDNDGDRVFTLHLRPGHRWSDGHPFTAEDFRFYWEDVLNNPVLSPQGPPSFLRVHGAPPRFEVLNETTVRYAWDAPNRAFLPALAGSRPEFLYQPAHYLQRFHARYGDVAPDWASDFRDASAQYRNTNPQLPSLQPWVHAEATPDGRFVFARNPFFHRVDGAGQQLPYIDQVELRVVDPAEIPRRVADGEADLQALGLSFEHFAMLKLAEARTDMVVELWVTAAGSEVALYPNLTASDPTWQDLLRQADFRRALSLAIDRAAINQLVFHGLGIAAANTVLRESPLYQPDFETAWTSHDPVTAATLLDGLGLERTGADGWRRLPDGRPLDLVIAATAERPSSLEVLRLVADAWSGVGLATRVETMPRDELRRRALAGDIVMSAWKGLENGVPGPNWPPSELVPSEAVQLGWPAWGLYVESGGFTGRPVDDPAVARLVFLAKAWETAENRAERAAAWRGLLAWHAENVFSIGTVHGVPQPVVRRQGLRNVPADAIYNWEPGAYFGLYGPPAFWFDTDPQGPRPPR